MLSHASQTLRTFMHSDGALLLPELELLLFAIGILLMDFWVTQKEKYWSPALALAGAAFSGSTLWMLRGRILQGGDLVGVHETMVVDAYFIFFAAIFLIAIALVTLLSMHYPTVSAIRQGRYYALLLMGCAAMMFLVSAVDLVVIFLALEALAVASYFLASSPGVTTRPPPSAVQFILSSALGSALLAYGFSILYGLSAATNIGKIASALSRRYNVAKVIALSRQPGSQGTQMYQLLQTRLPEALHLSPYVVQALPVAAVAGHGICRFAAYLVAVCSGSGVRITSLRRDCFAAGKFAAAHSAGNFHRPNRERSAGPGGRQRNRIYCNYLLPAHIFVYSCRGICCADGGAN
jgi:hypothetical protein